MDILPKRSIQTFINDDFLLSNEFSRRLYHEYAKNQPIIDYHNHLSPEQIANNKIFDNITEIWLKGDHYKWRAMRTLGIDEHYITGDSNDWQKFEKWSYAVPYTLRNPLYHWTQLELQRYFGIHELLDQNNAMEVYKITNEQVTSPEFSTQSLLSKMNVEVVCSTDDPTDSLEYHRKSWNSESSVKMFPAFRPDKSYTISSPNDYRKYIDKLGDASGISIHNYDDLLSALQNRVDFFHENGCRLSDHGLENLYHFKNSPFDPQKIFKSVMEGNSPSDKEASFFKFKTLQALCKMYHAKGWTQQFHLGALRNNNSRMFNKIGADTGFDSIGDFSQASALSGFLNEMDKTDQLAKTVLYNLNPSDNEVMATMTGNFNDGSIKGKIQFGSGWWFLDQKDGMESQMNTLSNMGLISCFVGMLTDSRSFLSFPRHEYFRRILCNLFGKDMQNGELPQDEKWIGKIIQDICYHNAKDFFQFPDK
jgi:glucuronate isomerase